MSRVFVLLFIALLIFKIDLFYFVHFFIRINGNYFLSCINEIYRADILHYSSKYKIKEKEFALSYEKEKRKRKKEKRSHAKV